MFKKSIVSILCFAMSFPFTIFADETEEEQKPGVVASPESAEYMQPAVPDSTALAVRHFSVDSLATDTIMPQSLGIALREDSIASDSIPYEFERSIKFKPDPTRAVWMSALCPGLGQIYNRRYWKLPIVIGGYVGLAYATAWNGRMLSDYTRAYRDIMDSDPNTKSYMDFYPSTTKEEDLDMSWLQRSLKSKKDFYRRNRDLCIICMVGLYLVCMVDAYVDASLSQFDISPNLSMQVAPAVIESNSNSRSLGVQCAFTF